MKTTREWANLLGKYDAETLIREVVAERDSRIFKLEATLKNMALKTQTDEDPYQYDLAAEWVRKVVKEALE